MHVFRIPASILRCSILSAMLFLFGCPAPVGTPPGECNSDADPGVYCEAGEVCLAIPDRSGEPLDGLCAAPPPPPSAQKQDVSISIDLANKNAGQNSAVAVKATVTKGDLRTREVAISKPGDATIRSFVPGESLGFATGVEYETGAFIDADIVADSSDTAFLDINADEVNDAFEPDITVDPLAGEGDVFLTIQGSLEEMLGVADNIYVNPSDAEVNISLNADVLTNPSIPGVYDVPVAATTIDPTGNGLPDLIDPPALDSILNEQITIFDPNPNTACATNPGNYFFEFPSARRFTIENQGTGDVFGPFAIRSFPNPFGLQYTINPTTLDIFEGNVYVTTLGGFWAGPGVCPDTHLQVAGDDPFLGPNPDPGVCGYGCPVFDNVEPDQPPEFSQSFYPFTFPGAGQAFFSVEATDELPEFRVDRCER